VKKQNKIKIIIIVLAVLLALSLAALAVTLIYNSLHDDTHATVTVPDNLITPESDASGDETSAPTEGTSESGDGETSADKTNGTDQAEASASAQSTAAEAQKATSIKLFSKRPEENTPFQVGNMFPGDGETKYYRVQVSYHDAVTVHYHATVRPGYEKLAEVMRVRVKLLTTGETMYDGLMRDMPESLTHKLASNKSTTDELYYEITAYLDTSVGNDYQNKDLIADFSWWVEETENLDSPQTGDTSNIPLWAVLAGCSGSMMILLLVVRRRKEDKGNG
jgi:LPXTG-motif cell wall-anchored protein